MSKDLKDKAINIQGKQYVLVSDRIIYFNQNYPNGAIVTQLLSPVESDVVVVKAFVIPDHANKERQFTGYSQAVKGAGFINKTAALENAETSAVGRALAMMGIGVIDSVASADEVNKAQGTDPKIAKAKSELLQEFTKAGVTEFKDQLDYIETVTGERTLDTIEQVDKVIRQLRAK